ncbi:MAG: NADPH:quinone oxidoreductase family protein [Acidobacteriota bacterium]
MRALLCTRYGPPDLLEVRDVASPVAGPGQVVVSVRAAGVNFPDVLIIQNKYQFKPTPPFSPGSELAGTIKAVGAGVEGFDVGDRVMAFTTFGAFAEEVPVDAARLLPVPEGMDFTTAAALLLTYGTMDHALRDRAAFKPGETALVLGAAGGIGVASIQIAKVLGGRVIACASDEDKLLACRRFGADETINYETDDVRERVKALTGGRGADVICDPVGGRYTEPAFRSIAWRGRHLVLGFAAGDIPKIPLNLALLKGASIVGVFWGDFARREPEAFRASVRQLGVWHAAGHIAPHISATVPLDRAKEALADMAARRVVGKVVVMMR